MRDNLSEKSKETQSSDITFNIQPKENFMSLDNSNTLDEFLNEQKSSLKYFLTKCDKTDKYISNYIHEIEVNIWIERFIYIFGRLFNTDMIIGFYILLFLYKSFFKKNYFFVIKPFIHVFVVFILTGILKYNLKRPRPEIKENVKRRYNIRKKETNFSMPSGDSMQAGNFAIIALYYFGSNYGFILIPFVMFARIFYFCHYLLDTVVGAIVGISISWILVYPLRNI